MGQASRQRIVILGGSFGGLTAAHALRRSPVRERLEITVVSKDDRFTFIPSLPWVTMGHKSLEQISFPIRPSLEAKGIRCVSGEAERIDAQARKVVLAAGDLEYDYLVIATGHRSANEAVPGLGPFDGPGHSLMSPREAVEAGEAWKRFLDDPGPMVIGSAPGASCLGPAYEFAFEVDHALKRRGMRHRVPITFVTPEPFLGHFGVGGMGRARQFLEGEFEHRDIRYRTSAAVSKITASSVELAGGEAFESRYSLIIPPLAGVPAIARSPGLGNPKGFVPTDEAFRHKEFENVYAVGVAVGYPPVDQTPVPVNFPKTGHMTVQMAKAAARNIAAAITGGAPTRRPPFVECILDMGDTAARMLADPVRPPRNRVKMSVGRRWLWAKQLYAPYFTWKMRTGRV
ncbi:MAG: FAD-dependent oxidoreductase [Deltaproteobacteria bacterium]|nr:FAD-dependent oxidoreductase [Deltaproteobacteria bacterium]